MNILGVETSHQFPQIGLLRGEEQIVQPLSDPTGRQPARKLLPALEAFLASAKVRAQDLDLIAIDIGPGSFTGLRIAVTTVKTLAYVTQTPVIAVGSLELSLRQLPQQAPFPRVAVVDAQRKMVYSLSQDRPDEEIPTSIEAIAMQPATEILQRTLHQGILTGPATELIQRAGEVQQIAEPFCPSVETLISIAKERFEQTGQGDDLMRLVPWYIRKSAAEEKAEANG